MRILNLETFMPYRIGDGFKPEFIKEGKAEGFMHWAEPRSRKVAVLNSVPLYYLSDSSRTDRFFWAKSIEEDDLLVYFMKLKKVKVVSNKEVEIPDFLLKRACFQAEVWRHGSITSSEGLSFVTQVFNKYLISNTRNVMTDESQTDLGERFWEKRLADALSNPAQKLWIVDVEVEGQLAVINTYRQIFTRKEAFKAYSEGQDLSCSYRRLMITKA